MEAYACLILARASHKRDNSFLLVSKKPFVPLQFHSFSARTANSLNRRQSIRCYHCNSEYDPRCADPFDAYSLGDVNCSMRPLLEHLQDYQPIICRKTVQKVYGKVRVVRGCGYIEETSDRGCIRRAGTHDVMANYCSCKEDLCNAANPIQRPLAAALALLAALRATVL
uniref:Protein sleepless n=1 Tax=Timema genevievae TaxID=629358 RepID=A0A7R9PL07_TIMGE|nr:unnamed protein product [Timema genevievae]